MTVTGTVKKIDTFRHRMLLKDETEIPFENLWEIVSRKNKKIITLKINLPSDSGLSEIPSEIHLWTEKFSLYG